MEFLKIFSSSLERVSPWKRDGVAKICGVFVCIIGASVLATYQGPPLIHSTSSNLQQVPTSLEEDHSSSSWKLGILCLLGNCGCMATYLVLQVLLSTSFFLLFIISKFLNIFTTFLSILGSRSSLLSSTCFSHSPFLWIWNDSHYFNNCFNFITLRCQNSVAFKWISNYCCHLCCNNSIFSMSLSREKLYFSNFFLI